MQKQQPRFSPVRRLIFPYDGRDALTHKQARRVIITWALFFSLIILIASLPVAALLNSSSLGRLVLSLLIVFLAGMIIFGLFAWFVVLLTNQSARVRQKQKEKDAAKDVQQ